MAVGKKFAKKYTLAYPIKKKLDANNKCEKEYFRFFDVQKRIHRQKNIKK